MRNKNVMDDADKNHHPKHLT